MKKRLLVSLMVFMSVSLLGIIFIQGYWIKKSVGFKEEEFTAIVSGVLVKVTEKIAKREMDSYFDDFLRLKDSIGSPKSSHLKNFFFFDRNLNTNETTVYSHGILEEDYNMASSFFDAALGMDSTMLKGYRSQRARTIFKENKGFDDSKYTFSSIEKLVINERLTETDKTLFDNVYREGANKVPIHNRLSNQEIALQLSRELKNRGLDIDFEYGVYSQDLPTKIKSKRFKYDANSPFKAPLFEDGFGQSNFSLHVSFPKKNKFLLGSIISMALMSVVFTLVIIAAFISVMYQLIKQKKISEIKSDFINNMTHEFKTPIATINLAVEAIKNPKIIHDHEKVMRYATMIKEENKRMHAQVENVLRISKLDRNQLEIQKEPHLLHEVVSDAITHISLIVADRGGYVNTHFNDNDAMVFASEMHLTNLFVNILDNAIKYSPESPQIDVYTSLNNAGVLIEIKDQGAGMSKGVLKQVFEKFYREHTGNIHNVKGHGLGLAYVKKIVENHQGQVYAESEKGSGSTFFVQLPLLKE
jgi:two-component system phosphate regulon sensor histidine kinase PhoR